jgi:superfamily I DNA/RNA helicase
MARVNIERRIFLEGPAGSGKTTVGVGRLLHVLDPGVPAESILVIVPQRTRATPYHEALRRPAVKAHRAYGQVTWSGCTTASRASVVRRMTDLSSCYGREA